MNKRAIVTKESDDGTFEVGDHIIFYENGDIGCIEGQGWISAENVPSATAGMEYRPDSEWLEKQKQKLKDALAMLENE